jgi:hypothetical protein
LSRIAVDTPVLHGTGARVAALGGQLAAARTALVRVQTAGYEADAPAVAAAVERFVERWGATIAALEAACEGLGANAIASAFAYDQTDGTAMGGGGGGG